MTGRRVLAGAVAVAAFILLAGRWSATLYTDYLWYLSLGANEVWRSRLLVSGVLTAASFLAASAFAFVNLYAVRQSVVSLVLPRRMGNIEIGEEVPSLYLMLAAVGMSVVLGAALTLPGDLWHSAILARGGHPFGETDPYFAADFGFFVYWIPFETAVHFWMIAVLVSVSVVVIVLYALTPSLRWDRGTLHVSAYVRRHFTMLGAVLLLVLAWSYRLAMYRLLFTGGGPSGLFSTTDHHMIPVMLLLSVVTLCAAFVVAWAGWSGQIRLAFGAVSAVLLLSLLARTAAPLFFRRASNTTPRSAQDISYVGTRLAYTRRAFAVDRMRAESLGVGFTAPGEVTTQLAVWDGATLARVAERTRHSRVYGDGAGWIASPGGISALLVERGGDAAPEARDEWSINRFAAATTDDRGAPQRGPGAFPSADEHIIEEPAVYDGAPEYSIVSDSARQLAGAELVSTRSRLLHAWSLQNFRILFGELPANRPKILRRRDVRERLQAVAPFFVQGSEVVPCVASDTLYWIVEMYSASSTYPLSQRFTVLGAERGYVQHAATALVHAASGRVHLILDPSPDPVALSWVQRFPRLFWALSSVAPSIRAALPPITDGARAQALAFAAAGFVNDAFEIRHFASPDGADSSAGREPAHLAIPSQGGVSAVWTLLDSAERVRGVVSAVGGATRLTSWVPLAADGNRWGTVLDRLRQADSAQRESGIVRAAMRVVPVNGRAVYVQPIFQSRPGMAPAMLRVVALVNDSVRSGKTLAAALGAASATRPDEPAIPRDLRAHADSLYRVMREALSRSDWSAFGRAFDALGRALHGTIR